MGEQKRFDPVGWFLSVCLTVLIGVVALVVAVELVQALWVWLVVGVVLVLLVVGGGRAALWWQRRRLW